jgi:hypothetical protein
MDRTILDYYAAPATMTDAGRYADAFAALAREVGALARTVQGLLLHEHWALAYEQTLSPERRAESQLRQTERMLEHILARDPVPLDTARPVERRLVGVCRHFTVLTVAMLRAKGLPARARCGFGGYFRTGRFEDHWVVEYWNAADGRWRLADTQIDALQSARLKPDFDLLDVPRDRFVIAGDAWSQCRAGKADPSTFGLSFLKEHGLWFIAQNLIRDFAALNNMEMLPWDVWGAMARPDESWPEDRLAFFDQLAALTQRPDACFAELRQRYEGEKQLHVPPAVYNAVLKRLEAA